MARRAILFDPAIPTAAHRLLARVLLAALACAALAGGCQGSSEAGNKAPAASGTATVAAPVSTAAQGASSSDPAPKGKVVLDALGGSFGRTAAVAQHFSYGSARHAVETAAEAALGVPAKRYTNGECGAGPMDFTEWPALTLNFQDDKFVGWTARENQHVVTVDGIRPGTFWRDLKVARSARMIPGSTLEGEFDYLAADGKTIGGFITGTGKQARIDSLYAGGTCFFR